MSETTNGFWHRQNLIANLPVSRFKMAHKAYLRVLNEAIGNDGVGYPSLRRIAQSMGCAERTVDKCQVELIAAGVVRVTSAKQSGCKKSNRYFLNVERLEALAEITAATAVMPKRNTAATAEIIPQSARSNTAATADKQPLTTKQLPLGLSTNEFRTAWTEWETHRKEKRSSLTATTKSKQLKKLELMGVAKAIATLQHSIEQGYTGLVEPRSQGGQRLRSKRTGAFNDAE